MIHSSPDPTAIAWFNLGEALENLNRESDALGAYRNARELFLRLQWKQAKAKLSIVSLPF